MLGLEPAGARSVSKLVLVVGWSLAPFLTAWLVSLRACPRTAALSELFRLGSLQTLLIKSVQDF